jgi:hypothetical protein
MCVAATPSVARAQWYPYPPMYPYRYHVMDNLRSAVRLEVTPKEAEVYVDGFYAGIVDDFNGTFQRLRVTPGQHEIIVRRDGFRSLKEDVYLAPDSTYHVRRALEPLGAGEPNEPRPTPMAPPSAGAGRPGEYEPTPGGPPPAARRAPPRRTPPPEQTPRDQAPRDPREPAPREMAPRDASNYGTLVIRVQPGDAEIRIDGELWRGPAGDERLVIQMPEGPHRVEIQKDGFQRFSSDVQVRRGETTPVNVSLSPRD